MSPTLHYGLLGWPVSHSFSPAMHNAAFKAAGIDADYRLFPVHPMELDTFLEELEERSISGLNVTVPYKEQVMDFVSLDADQAHLKTVGAVNTTVNESGTWKGYNTDIPGFLNDIRTKFDPAGARTAIVGAGGASRAVAFALAQAKAAEIRIFDIEHEKAGNVAGMVAGLFRDTRVLAVGAADELGIPDCSLLINATPLGLKPDDALPVDAGFLHRKLFVYDLIYNPGETALLRAAKNAGAKVANGLGMLLHQGMLSFELWTKQKAPAEAMETALCAAIAAHAEKV